MTSRDLAPSLSLTSDQAQALFDAGGFAIITDLPEGSEFSIDGTFHIIRQFSGIKFLPPGFHFLTWSPPPSRSASNSTASAVPATIPLRSGLLRYFRPRERLILRYDPHTESIPVPSEQEVVVISDERLKSLDRELAPYPFEGLEMWKRLTSEITEGLLKEVVGETGRLDGMTPVEGGDGPSRTGRDGKQGVQAEETRRKEAELAQMLQEGNERKLKFPVFDIKRSWRDGAVGEEITRYSRDKSWLLGRVIAQAGGDPLVLLGHLQLSFILLLHLSSYSSLQVYQRILTLFCHSPSFLADPTSYLPSDTTRHPGSTQLQSNVAKVYITLVHTLAAQLAALPKDAFEGELPELDVFYLDEIEALRRGLARGRSGWPQGDVQVSSGAWQVLRKSCEAFGWEVGVLTADEHPDAGRAGEDEEDEEDEEGEYAPVVVEL